MQSDDQLQQQLAAADPAASSKPLDPQFLARVRARIEETTTMTATQEAERTSRRRWVPYVAGIAVAAAAALAIGVVVSSGDDTGDEATAPVTTVAPTSPPTTAVPTTGAKTPAVVERPAGLEPAPPPGDPTFMICAQFDPAILATAPVAFDGVVSAIDETTVTFEVLNWFRGGSGQILETDGVYMTGDAVALIGGAPAIVGDRYLVAAELYSDAVRPGSCGWVQPYTEEMATTYAQAFAA